MPYNLTKKYPDLLELFGNIYEMKQSLRRIYDRDIENNPDFKFRGIQIHPLKSEEGQLDMTGHSRILQRKSMLRLMLEVMNSTKSTVNLIFNVQNVCIGSIIMSTRRLRQI